MKVIRAMSSLNLELTITLTEAEARALTALTEYGTDVFLKSFYQNLGTSALRPYEQGLVSLFENARSFNQHFKRADEARKLFDL